MSTLIKLRKSGEGLYGLACRVLSNDKQWCEYLLSMTFWVVDGFGSADYTLLEYSSASHCGISFAEFFQVLDTYNSDGIVSGPEYCREEVKLVM